MHDIKAIRENPAHFDARLAARGLAPLSSEILKLDADLRSCVTRLQEAQARRNAASKEIGKAKAAKDGARADALMAEVASLKDVMAAGEAEERELAGRLKDALDVIPNLPLMDVPIGPDETANQEVRRYLAAPNLLFAPKQHFEIGEALGMMDFESAQKVSGARFVFLKRDLARLERALASFMLDLHTGKFGYEEVAPPLLVRDEAAYGTGNLPKFKHDLFATYRFPVDEIMASIDKAIAEVGGLDPTAELLQWREAVMEESVKTSRLWLIPTSEVSLTNLVREQIVDEASLPRRYTAWTPCFRSEAGAAGRDTRGMIRQHQFSKVELVSVTTPEASLAEHERMTEAAETVLKRLGLPFRTMLLCTGDMGFASQKTYDIEVWLPGQNAYREISSCSVCGDFQARRMNARYRPKGSKETRFVHTLNGSGLAVGRTLVAVLENYQQADGSVIIPEALRSYMGQRAVIEPVK